MNTYFKNVQTLDELRKQYKDLLKDSHSRQSTAEGNTYHHRKEFKELGFKFVTMPPASA